MDTAEAERFRSLVPCYYRGCHGIMIFYDATNINSFESIKYWTDHIKNHTNSDNIVKFLIAI